MAKLYFNFGAMGCGKTRDLMKVWYNYQENGKNAINFAKRFAIFGYAWYTVWAIKQQSKNAT